MGDTSFAQSAVPSLIPPGTSAISGVLIDARTKQPIAGCTVGLIQVNVPRNALTTTDFAGAYAFTGIADAEYFVNVFCDSHLSSCYRSQGTEPPRCDTVAVVVDQRKSNVDFTLIPGASAQGRVVDASGRPIPGATVRLGLPRFDARFVATKPAKTNRDGSFTMTNLPVGGYLMKSIYHRRPARCGRRSFTTRAS